MRRTARLFPDSAVGFDRLLMERAESVFRRKTPRVTAYYRVYGSVP